MIYRIKGNAVGVVQIIAIGSRANSKVFTTAGISPLRLRRDICDAWTLGKLIRAPVERLVRFGRHGSEQKIARSRFGRDEQTEESDVDLRLECDPSMTYGIFYRISHELERELGREVEIVTNPPERMGPRFGERAQNEEVRLY